MNDNLQSQLTYFLWPRHVLGWITVVKRCVSVVTVGTILEGHPYIGIGIIVLREALSAIADYSAAKSPIVTTQQSSPPATNPISDETTT